MTGPTPALPRPTEGSWSRRRLLLALAAFWAAALVAGAVYAYVHRHDAICRDGRAPVAQRDYGLGQVQYRCHDGEIVTKP